MDRSHVVEQLGLYADGMLTAAEAERVDAHLAGCESCRAEWEALRYTLDLLRSVPGEEPPEDLAASIMAQVRAEARRSAGRDRWTWSPRWGMAAAAAVLVLLGAGWIADRWGGRDATVLMGGAAEQAVVDDAAAGSMPRAVVDVAPTSLAGGLAGDGAEMGMGAAGLAQGEGPGTAAPAQRRVIHSAYLVIRVDDVEGTYHQVIALAEAAGGFAQEASLSDDGPGIILPPVGRRAPEMSQPRSAHLVLRVPTPRFTGFTEDVMALGKPGTPRDYRTNASDITAEYVDVEARLRNMRAKESRLLEILGQAENVEDLLAVEREVWQARAEIESLQARLNTWDQLLDLATLHLTIREAGVAPPDRDHGVGGRLLLAFYQGVDYLVVGVETMIVGVGVLLPWVLLAGIVWLLYRWSRRRRSAAP